MKKLLLLGLFIVSVIGGDRPLRRHSAPIEIPQTHLYNSALTIADGDITIVLNAQLESKVYSREKKVEIVLKLWELDRLIATKKVTLNW